MTTENILAPVASLALPDSAAMSDKASKALAFIKEFTIASHEDYGFAAEELRAIKARAKAVEDQRTAITNPLNKVLKAVNDLFRGPAALLEEGERTLKTKMLAWDQKQAAIAAEARRKAEEAAQAERNRLAEEAAKIQREAEVQAAAAAKAQSEGNAQAAAIAQAAADRAQSEAAAAAATSQMVVAAAPAVEAPTKAKGISTSTKIDFEVVNLHALVMHIAEHPELLALVAADQVKLRAYVRGLGAACRLPGVKVIETQTMSARAA